MSLPIRTTLDDLDAVCSYLVTKPTGATTAEAKAVVDKKHLDGRKLNALKFWGLVEDDGNKMKITARGRQLVKDSGSSRSKVLGEVVRQVAPYAAVIERVAHRREEAIDATAVAAHWYEHFKSDVSDSDKILNDQAVCFFQIAQGADLGTLTIGRKGRPTRFEFDTDVTQAFVDVSTADTQHDLPADESTEINDLGGPVGASLSLKSRDVDGIPLDGNRVFITHGKNHKILDQVKELVAYGKYEPVVAIEHETAAKPVPQKVMDDMRSCMAAVIHVSSALPAGRVQKACFTTGMVTISHRSMKTSS